MDLRHVAERIRELTDGLRHVGDGDMILWQDAGTVRELRRLADELDRLRRADCGPPPRRG